MNLALDAIILVEIVLEINIIIVCLAIIKVKIDNFFYHNVFVIILILKCYQFAKHVTILVTAALISMITIVLLV